MTNKLVVIINSLKVPKIKKILLYETKFLVRNYSCVQNPRLRGYSPQIPVLSVLCPQLNLLNPSEKNSSVRHCCKVVEDQLHALITTATGAGRRLGYSKNVAHPSAPFGLFGRQQTGSRGSAVFLSHMEPRFPGLLSHRTVPGAVSFGRKRP